MKAILLYRTAAVLLLLFALGHTFGFLRFTPTTTEGRAVQSAMNNVRLVTNADFTYGKFYTGFGLFATTYLLFSAFLAWYLGGLTSKHPESVSCSCGLPGLGCLAFQGAKAARCASGTG